MSNDNHIQSGTDKLTPPAKLTRRSFLAKAGALPIASATLSILPGALWSAPVKPNDRINAGLIGIGAMGSGHLGRLAGDPGVNLLAVCEVDPVRRNRAKDRVEAICAQRKSSGTYRGCIAYHDYREVLARPDIDAVLIATPDHWHTLQSIHAVQAGKDVYCEKPISLTIEQGRQLVQTIRRFGRVFQTGTQYRSIPTIREVCHFVRGGGLGQVKSVFTLWQNLSPWLDSPRCQPYAQAMDLAKSRLSYAPLNFQLPAEPVPEGLDWNLWVGPAPWHPYNSLFHTNPSPGVVPWSFCEDFGAASVTWFHSHAADVIQYALGVEESGPVEFIHPSSGEFPTLTCKYSNGTQLHLVEHWGQVKDLYKAVPSDARLAGNFGGIFVGERGWVTSMSVGGPIEGGPEEIFTAMKLRTREVNIGANNHHANWFQCIRSRGKPSCHEELGHRSASLGHLTIIAFKLGRSLKWNPMTETFVGDDEANRLLSRALREPWQA